GGTFRVRRHAHDLVLVLERHHALQERYVRVQEPERVGPRNRPQTLEPAVATDAHRGAHAVSRAVAGDHERRRIEPAGAVISRGCVAGVVLDEAHGFLAKTERKHLREAIATALQAVRVEHRCSAQRRLHARAKAAIALVFVQYALPVAIGRLMLAGKGYDIDIAR